MITYKARENQIVSSRLDLEQSIINNLSIFFDAFQQKLIYEIKLVSSVTFQDGTTQTGTAHQVQSGTYANGTPKYKTIVNKFAVMDIYIKLEGMTRKKITRLNLAPVDILSYKPTLSDLETESNSIGLLINTGLIATPIVTPTTQQTTTPQIIGTVALPNGTANQYYQSALKQKATINKPGSSGSINTQGYEEIINAFKAAGYTMNGNQAVYKYGDTTPMMTVTVKPIITQPAKIILFTAYGYTIYTDATITKVIDPDGSGVMGVKWTNTDQTWYWESLNGNNVKNYASQYYTGQTTTPTPTPTQTTTYQPSTNPPVTPTPTTTVKPGASASTLYDWYTANGQSLPSISARAVIYQSKGLGPSSTYVGSAEQNNALLAKLKLQ